MKEETASPLNADTPAKVAYLKEMAIEGGFDIAEKYIAISYSDSLNQVLAGLRNDAMLEKKGWGENLYFFLKGLEVAGVITSENVKLVIKQFVFFDENTFRKYEHLESPI